MKKQLRKLLLTSGAVLPLTSLVAISCGETKNNGSQSGNNTNNTNNNTSTDNNANTDNSENNNETVQKVTVQDLAISDSQAVRIENQKLFYVNIFKESNNYFDQLNEELSKFSYSSIISEEQFNALKQKLNEYKVESSKLEEKMANNENWEIFLAKRDIFVENLQLFLGLNENVKSDEVEVVSIQRYITSNITKYENANSDDKTLFNTLYDELANKTSEELQNPSNEEITSYKNKFMKLLFYKLFVIDRYETKEKEDLEDLKSFLKARYSKINDSVVINLKQDSSLDYAPLTDFYNNWEKISKVMENDDEINNINSLKELLYVVLKDNLQLIEFNNFIINLFNIQKIVTKFPNDELILTYKTKAEEINTQLKEAASFETSNIRDLNQKMLELCKQFASAIEPYLQKPNTNSQNFYELQFDNPTEMSGFYAQILNMLKQGVNTLLSSWTTDFVEVAEEIAASEKTDQFPLSYTEIALFYKGQFINDFNQKVNEILLSQTFNFNEFATFQEKVSSLINYLIQTYYPFISSNQEIANQFVKREQPKEQKIIVAFTVLNMFKQVLNDYSTKVNEENLQTFKDELTSYVTKALEQMQRDEQDSLSYNFNTFKKALNDKLNEFISIDFIKLEKTEINSDTFLSLDDNSLYDEDDNSETLEDFSIINFDELMRRLNKFVAATDNEENKEKARANIEEFKNLNEYSNQKYFAGNDVLWTFSLPFKYIAGNSTTENLLNINLAEVSANKPLLSKDESFEGTLSYKLNQKYAQSSDKKYLLSFTFDTTLVSELNYNPFIRAEITEYRSTVLGNIYTYFFAPLLAKEISYAREENRNVYKINLAYSTLETGKYIPISLLGSLNNNDLVFSLSPDVSLITFVVEISVEDYNRLKTMSISPIDPKINSISAQSDLTNWKTRSNRLIEFIQNNDYKTSTEKLKEALSSNETNESTLISAIKEAFDETFANVQTEYLEKEQEVLSHNLIKFSLD